MPAKAATPRPIPARPRRASTRTALIEAGLRLLAQRPVDGISVDEIVATAGVAKGSFFYHFADKFAFAEAIAADVRLDVETQVAAVNAQVSDPVLRMLRGVCCFVRFACGNRDMSAVLLRGSVAMLAPQDRLNAGLRADVLAALNDGRLAGAQADSIVLQMMSLTRVVMTLAAPVGMAPQDVHAVLRDLLAITLRGLGLADAEARALIDAAINDILTSAG